ncbi:MAG: hypothetical protein DLM70_11535, partial [Chloroflexi bacterium]
TMGLEIDQDGGVHLAATEREIIDAEYPWGGHQREDGATQQAEEYIGTDRQTGGTSQPDSGFPAGRLG